MELKEVLEQVPGLTRRFVYYLEARNYIQPTKVQKQRIARREYSEGDLATIRNVWRYYQRGYAFQTAYELATTSERVVTYLGVQVPFGCAGVAIDRLRQYPQVVEVAAVYGAGVDFWIKTDTPDASEIYHTLVPLLAEMGITGMPDLLFARQGFQKEGLRDEMTEQPGMQAYILLTVPGKDVEGVMDQLKGFEPVREASMVYGESDIIARVRVADQEELDTLVMQQIHGIPAVESTRTYVVVRRLHWSR